MSFGASASESDAKSRSYIDPTQLGYLQQLWGAGNTLMNQFGPGAYFDQANQTAQGALGFGTPGAQTFAGGAAGNLAGQQQLAQNMNSQSPWLNQQIGNLGQDISRNLAQNILPELRSGGIAAGAGPTAGGGGIAQGMAAEAAQRDFATQATQLRAADVMRQQQAAQALTASQMAGAQGALSGMGQMYNMGMAPWQAMWLPLQMQAGLLGRPTIVGEGDEDSRSGGLSVG